LSINRIIVCETGSHICSIRGMVELVTSPVEASVDVADDLLAKGSNTPTDHTQALADGANTLVHGPKADPIKALAHESEWVVMSMKFLLVFVTALFLLFGLVKDVL